MYLDREFSPDICVNRLLSSVTIRARCTAPPFLLECHYQICCASPVALLRGDFGRFYLCLFICICWRRRSGPLKIAGTPGVSGGAFGGSDSRGPSCVVFPARRASCWKMLPSSVPGHCRGPPTGMDINQEKPHQNGVGRPEGGLSLRPTGHQGLSITDPAEESSAGKS